MRTRGGKKSPLSLPRGVESKTCNGKPSSSIGQSRPTKDEVVGSSPASAAKQIKHTMANMFKKLKPKKPILEMTDDELAEFKNAQRTHERRKARFFQRVAVLAFAIAIFRLFYTGSLIELAKAIWQQF